MEIELVDTHVAPVKSTTASGQWKFAKDEAVLARFGKRQQLHVSTFPRMIDPSRTSFSCGPFANSAMSERVWTAICS